MASRTKIIPQVKLRAPECADKIIAPRTGTEQGTPSPSLSQAQEGAKAQQSGTGSSIFSSCPRVSSDIVETDLSFLMRSALLRVTPENLKRSLLSALTRLSFSPGERIIRQGTQGDCLFILQHGSCEVNLEKNNELHLMGHLRPGDIFGEVSVVTGERRTAHVDALTEVVVWSLDKEIFDGIARRCYELTEFLVNLATERLCSHKITAERNIGRYRITDVIAEGGWSIVYKGFHSILNLPVAIKMLKHSMALDSDFFETFQKEAKTIAALNHDNIVRVYDIEQSYRTVFIIMEYLSGVTLREILDSGFRMPLDKILRYLSQICAGLQYAHEHGVAHQDVKPGNIFIQDGEKAKIVDFGLATPIGGCSDDMPGTPHYMAPEQIEGEPVDARTDIYSLGITAYEMATGIRPYPDDICQVLEYHMTRNTPDPRELNPLLPESFANFIRKSTEKAPESRFQNVSEALHELEIMAQELHIHKSPLTAAGRKVRNIYLSFDSDNEQGIEMMLNDFCDKLKKIGVDTRLS